MLLGWKVSEPHCARGSPQNRSYERRSGLRHRAASFPSVSHQSGMSKAQTQSDTIALDRQLNQAILAGDLLNAFEKFYADDVVMQENDSPPFIGKDVNRKREQEFIDSVQQV